MTAATTVAAAKTVRTKWELAAQETALSLNKQKRDKGGGRDGRTEAGIAGGNGVGSDRDEAWGCRSGGDPQDEGSRSPNRTCLKAPGNEEEANLKGGDRPASGDGLPTPHPLPPRWRGPQRSWRQGQKSS